jgi:hypothetical protein
MIRSHRICSSSIFISDIDVMKRSLMLVAIRLCIKGIMVIKVITTDWITSEFIMTEAEKDGSMVEDIMETEIEK